MINIRKANIENQIFGIALENCKVGNIVTCSASSFIPTPFNFTGNLREIWSDSVKEESIIRIVLAKKKRIFL